MCECSVMGSPLASLRHCHRSFRVTEPPYFLREAAGLITGASPLAKCAVVKVLDSLMPGL